MKRWTCLDLKRTKMFWYQFRTNLASFIIISWIVTVLSFWPEQQELSEITNIFGSYSFLLFMKPLVNVDERYIQSTSTFRLNMPN